MFAVFSIFVILRRLFFYNFVAFLNVSRHSRIVDCNLTRLDYLTCKSHGFDSWDHNDVRWCTVSHFESILFFIGIFVASVLCYDRQHLIDIVLHPEFVSYLINIQCFLVVVVNHLCTTWTSHWHHITVQYSKCFLKIYSQLSVNRWVLIWRSIYGKAPYQF